MAESGKKRIAYIKGKEDFQVVNNRFDGYLEGLDATGLAFDESLVYKAEFKMECGYKAAVAFMNLASPPDAIMAATDYMALGVLDYLHKKQLQNSRRCSCFWF